MKASSIKASPDRTPSPLDGPHSRDDSRVVNVKAPKNRVISLILMCGGIALVCALVWGAYYIGKYGLVFSVSLGIPSQNPLPSHISPTSVAVSSTPLFSGKLTRLSQNLSLFTLSEDDTLNGVGTDQFVYYSAGVFLEGELSGYTRIIAIRPSIGPGGPLSYTLATKDYQTYVLDDPEHNTERSKDDWANPYLFLDSKKITAVSVFPSEQSKTIDLNANFSLYRISLPILSVQTEKKDVHENFIYDTQIPTDFSAYTTVSSPVSNLQFFVKPYGTMRNMNELSENEKQKELLRKTYFVSDTDIVIVDSVGLPVTYSLTTPTASRMYDSQKKQYDRDVITYEAEVKKLQGDTDAAAYPKYPEYVYLPHMGFTRTDLQGIKTNTFTRYDQAIPGACATQLNTRVMKISENDLERVASFQSMPVYRLKDSHHPLYTLAYKNKLDYYDSPDSGWADVNKGMKKPTLEEYVNQNPLLFIEDYWHRWVALGEYDIQLPGGCGKPVIYLYPPKTTDVSVAFDIGVQLTTDIPAYSDSWLVRAHTDGQLTNLKPTSCDILSVHRGTEYAKASCEMNSYPYLYWSGNVRSGAYPYTKDGWIVPRDTLSGFLSDSLDAMGFTGKEAWDFMDYWVPEMLEKGTPLYRVSFFQTREVNMMFPMSVSPRPDSQLRMFMDYMPLTQKPAVLPNPQILEKFVRHGFTLVEWGGRMHP